LSTIDHGLDTLSGDVMVSVLALSTIDHGLDTRSGDVMVSGYLVVDVRGQSMYGR
jgi:hypothetical protein